TLETPAEYDTGDPSRLRHWRPQQTLETPADYDTGDPSSEWPE
ncbi:uncharacterized, partial [Tachysurus ichikawai]